MSANHFNQNSQIDFNTNLDLGRLALFETTPIGNEITEEDILEHTKKNLNILFSELFKLKVLQQGMGEENRDFNKPVNAVALPTPTTILPRARAIPKHTKTLTKWDQFMKDKGITKKKKSRMIYSEQLGEYLPRWGAGSIKKMEARSEAIIEDKPKYEGKNPFTVKKQEAKLTELKNNKQESDNKQKFLSKKRAKDTKFKEQVFDNKKKVEIAQKSTASVGRFDKKLKNEDKINTLKYKKVSSEVMINTKSEKQRDSKLMSRLLNTSS